MESPRDNLWNRVGLQDTDKTRCIDTVQGRYGDYYVRELEYQGHCSVTLLLCSRGSHKSDEDGNQNPIEMEDRLIVQLRPPQHALDLATALEARKAYSRLAPMVHDVGLSLPEGFQAYEMNKMGGTSFSRLQPHEHATAVDIRQKQETLVISLAKAIAPSWPILEKQNRRDSVLRPESPTTKQGSFLSLCTGKVGSRIIQKLEKLSVTLPDEWLRHKALCTLEQFRNIHEYPVVLNHGDLIPSNILVDEETWTITGLVDWAEAEQLPFGTCLYGLEHLLGFLHAPSTGSGSCTFIYYETASQLRERFWSALRELVPELRDRREEVMTMRDVGVLLWHGFAWDGGAIDRVVDGVNDVEELAKLRAFLSV